MLNPMVQGLRLGVLDNPVKATANGARAAQDLGQEQALLKSRFRCSDQGV